MTMPSRGERAAIFGRRVSKAKLGKVLSTTLGYLALIFISIVVLSPVAWLVSTALGSAADVAKIPHVWIPQPLRFDNFQKALTLFPFAKYTRNTLIITVAGVTGTLLSSSLVAYGFARLRFPGRDFLFLVLLGIMMLPGQVLMVPTFVLFRVLGWYNTFLPMIVPQWLGGGAFSIFLMRQFISGIPMELDEAARMDSCGTFGIWWRIILPLSKPVLATMGAFSFLGNWNNFLGPLIYIRSPDLQPFALALAAMAGRFSSVGTELVMAASLAFMLPCVLFLVVAQRYVVQGLAFTGLAGR